MSGTTTALKPHVDAGGTAAPGGRRWLVLLAMVFGLFMPMLDHLVVNVALPTIQRELGAGISGLQWIVDAYTLTFAALLLTGGSLGDIHGRKRLYMIGLVVFTVASAMSGLSSTTGQLAATRALQGVGAALVVPATLSIISATFSGAQRGAAIGIWGAIAGLAIAIGPGVGGALVEHVSWQSVFFINVPIGILALVFAAVVVPESRDGSRARRVDLAGLVLSAAAVTALTYALIEGNGTGWTDPRIVLSLLLAIVLAVAFVRVEMRSAAPMLPLPSLRNRTFAAANVVAALMFFAMIGTVFFLALYLQNVRGYSPADAGLRLLPFSAMILVFAPIAGKISDRKGSRGFMTAGPLLTSAGLALLLGTDVATEYVALILPAFMVMGIGWAITLAPMTSAVMGSVEQGRAGIASAVTNTSRELGGVLGVAAIGALVTASFTRAFTDLLSASGMPSDRISGLVAQVGSGAAGGSAGADPVVGDAIHRAFVEAIHDGMVVAIVAMVVAAAISLVFVRSHVTADQPVGGGEKPSADPVHPRAPV